MLTSMGMADGPISHTARTNAFEGEATWRLAPDALEREEGGRTAVLPYRAISQIRLSYAPTRTDAARYRCDIAFAKGATVHVFSSHFSGFATFEDRAATYTPLVRTLIARAAAANPKATFRAGKRPLVYLIEHAFLFAAFVLLIVVLSLVGGVALSGLVWVKLGLIVAYLPVAFLYMRRNWPRRFSADAIPDDVLPAASLSRERAAA